MTLWAILTTMIAAAAVLISAPFIRRFERTRLASAEHLAVYRDQLTEVERELAQGLIDAAQAESANVEIKRRIIAADRIAEVSGRPFTGSERNFAVTAVTGIVILGSIVLYAVIGSPDLPSASPLQASNEPAPVVTSRSAAPTQGMSQPRVVAGSESRDLPQPQSGLPPVEEMIQRVLTRLERSPKDADGWRLLGWSYFNIERFADAAQAYSRAIELRPESAEYRSARGEALVRAANGTVTPEARKDLDETLKLDPKDARARFFIGMAKEQDGNKEGAIADWNAIVADTDPNEPWLADLKQRLAALQRDRGGDSPITPARPGLTAESMQELLRADKKKPETAAERGPTADDVRKADAMSQPDRTAMIRGMVDGLASRLEQSPRDAEGWIKLIRSRAVLGEADLAKRSLQRALSVFAEDGAERSRIADAAKQLGIEP